MDEMTFQVLGAKEEKEVAIKTITCMASLEEVLISNQTGKPTNKKRFRYEFTTLKNDMGFGPETGDIMNNLVLFSLDQKKYEVGKSYRIKIEPNE